MQTKFEIACQCGRRIEVSERDAGLSLGCECGQSLTVPRLSELRQQSGHHPFHTNIADIVRDAVDCEDFLANRCAGCGSDKCQRINLWVECERAASSELSGLVHLCALILRVVIFEDPRDAHGHEKVIRLPLSLCPTCHSQIPNDRFEKPVVQLGMLLLLATVLCLFFNGPIAFVSAALLAFGGIGCCYWTRQHQTARQQTLRRYSITIPLYEKLLAEYREAEIVVGASVAQECRA